LQVKPPKKPIRPPAIRKRDVARGDDVVSVHEIETAVRANRYYGEDTTRLRPRPRQAGGQYDFTDYRAEHVVRQSAGAAYMRAYSAWLDELSAYQKWRDQERMQAFEVMADALMELGIERDRISRAGQLRVILRITDVCNKILPKVRR
jgi:hypothetical protein